MKSLVLIFVSTLLLAATSAYAGDASDILSLGFSAKGDYFAFVEYGINDGQGAAYARGVVVDVKKNAFARTAVIQPLDGVSAATVMKQAIAGLKLNTYGITAGKNLGNVLL